MHSVVALGTPAIRSSPGRCARLACLVVVSWAGAIWLSQQVAPSGLVRDVALLGHLVSLVVGLGAVLTLEWNGLHWLLGRRSLSETLRLTGGTHQLIWLGLAGLTVSGTLLSPDLHAPATIVKLHAVLLVGLNGLQADVLRRRLLEAERPGPGLLACVFLASALSQVGWWTAVVIGYLATR